MRQLSGVPKDVDRILYEELRLSRPDRPGSLFTSEQERIIAEASVRFPIVEGDPSATWGNQTARIEFLSSQLPGELFMVYKLTREGLLVRVNRVTAGFHPNRQEFFAIAEAVDRVPGAGMLPDTSAELKAALQACLKPERFETIMALQSPPIRAIADHLPGVQPGDPMLDTLVELRQKVYPVDRDRYVQQVSNLIANPAERSRYLANPWIHPEGTFPSGRPNAR
jgi:hypothetical protein